MKNSKRKLPKFKSEKEEQKFWDKHSPLDYFDEYTARLASFPNLKPSTKSISIRLPEGMINALKALANQRDVPYQSLIKVLLAQAIQRESGYSDEGREE